MFMVKVNCEAWLVFLGTLVAILLRVCTTLHPYSGENSPPMYGDYEAQRHWMEITTNLPIREWYKNVSDNDLNYWGLDYPPLTAYHMYVLGRIASHLNTNYTELHQSRGFESAGHKLFMRYSVIFTDLLIYIPSLILFYHTTVSKTVEKRGKLRLVPMSLATVLGLLYPGIILIDHGHFQYNNVSLGLAILATTLILQQRHLSASVLFVLALNYKQMELYHSLPFFMYLLSTCVPKPGQSYMSGLWKLAQIGVVVMVTFAVIWAPFLRTLDDLSAMLFRQFPIGRGVFEDKVANVWCSLNVFYKYKQHHEPHEMMRICLFATLSAVCPAMVDLFLRPNTRKFVLALINSSLGFFLFSFQVHEKTILLCAVPVLLYLPHGNPFVCFWFLIISVFSMIPLLVRDGLFVATFACTWFFIVTFRVTIEQLFRHNLNASDGFGEYWRSFLHVLLNIEYRKATRHNLIRITWNQIVKNRVALQKAAFHLFMLASLIGALVLTLVYVFAKPPAKYPDLFALIICAYSALHFVAFFIYFNVQQIRIPQQFDDIRNVKVKD